MRWDSVGHFCYNVALAKSGRELGEYRIMHQEKLNQVSPFRQQKWILFSKLHEIAEHIVKLFVRFIVAEPGQIFKKFMLIIEARQQKVENSTCFLWLIVDVG